MLSTACRFDDDDLRTCLEAGRAPFLTGDHLIVDSHGHTLLGKPQRFGQRAERALLGQFHCFVVDYNLHAFFFIPGKVMEKMADKQYLLAIFTAANRKRITESHEKSNK